MPAPSQGILFCFWLMRRFIRWGDGETKPSTTELSFRMSIQQALQSMFGLAGAAAIVDVLDWSEADNTGIIKVRQR